MKKIDFETTYLSVKFTILSIYKLRIFLPGDVTCNGRTDPPSLFTLTGVTNLVSSNIEFHIKKTLNT